MVMAFGRGARRTYTIRRVAPVVTGQGIVFRALAGPAAVASPFRVAVPVLPRLSVTPSLRCAAPAASRSPAPTAGASRFYGLRRNSVNKLTLDTPRPPHGMCKQEPCRERGVHRG